LSNIYEKFLIMKLLLHCCCAPCSIQCVKSLRGENIEPALFWYNPNIHPFTEYSRRRDCLAQFAEEENLKLEMLDGYGLRLFLDTVYPQTEDRCKKCYLLRLEKTASFASVNGYEAFTTTLFISPYQDHDALKLVCEEVSVKYGVTFLYRDFRPLFREGQERAREKRFYMQKYCGCIFSEEERYSQNGKRRSSRGDAETRRTQRKEGREEL
jgi:predicted adenine nucleotide alpha hydrolase (AANH) superfamily ATPase